MDAPGLVGRGAVWAELLAVLDPGRPDVSAVLLTGDAGIGKTTLVERFAAVAAERGHPVATTSGRADTAGTPYAGLRSLLAGSDQELADLPEVQQAALAAALGGQERGVDVLALRSAVSGAFDLLAGELPLVLVVDDVDRLDAPSFDVLLTVASVLAFRQLPVLAVFAARTERMPTELTDLLPAVPVPPLSGVEAERVLDGLPQAPTGSARQELLRRAAGNPLALRESSDDDGLFAHRVRELPPSTLRALTFAAAGEADLAVIARADPAITALVWQPAEDARLITLADTQVRFRHPLIEYAVLQAAGAQAGKQAHRLLAGAAIDPQSALRHRAAAADAPDPALAAELVTAARDVAGAVTAVGMLERAAELAAEADRAPALLEAAGRAAAVGRVSWAGEILGRAHDSFAAGSHPELVVAAAALESWTMTMRGRLPTATALLITALAADAPPPVRSTVMATAGFPAFLRGDPRLTAALTAAVQGRAQEIFPRAVVRPDEELRTTVLATSAPTSPAEIAEGTLSGAAAMLIDEPEHAVRLLGPAVRTVVERAAPTVFISAPGAAVWALIDTGRWKEAERWLVPLLTSPVSAEATLIRAGTYAQLLVIAHGRGRPEAVAELMERSRPLEPARVPAFRIRLRWAQGTEAAARGAHREAYKLLREACGIGTEIRHDWQVLPLPDLVAAAVRSGATAEAAAIVATFQDRYANRWLSERKRTRLAAARALLLDDAAGSADELTRAQPPHRWPFERAVLGVELADRLRRAHRPGPAREALVEALDIFDGLRATRWAARVNAELRTPGRADPFAGLSAQQEQIIRLAGAGLSNREIGERLFLSPRTIGSHLYRVFPQLGVANRTQLGDLLATADRQESPDRVDP